MLDKAVTQKGASFRDRLQLDFTRSNVLAVADGALTGTMVDQPWGDICDGAEKRRMLLETCARLGLSPKQSIAIGDGANDLPMMGEAGLSVAYHAKPKVREQAMVQINSGGLDRLLQLFLTCSLRSDHGLAGTCDGIRDVGQHEIVGLAILRAENGFHGYT